MSIRLGDVAPDFNADSDQGPISFHDWLGESWGILFSHPADFTPVCTTELGTAARLQPDFERRNVKMIALSVDSVDEHKKWIPDIEAVEGVKLSYPIIADEDRKVAELYGMMHPGLSETATVRSVFIIGPDKKLKLTMTYPMTTGRNFDEILRVIDSLQLTAAQPVATPADWRPGNDVIVSLAIDDADADKRFPDGVRKVKPYLRWTSDPS